MRYGVAMPQSTEKAMSGAVRFVAEHGDELDQRRICALQGRCPVAHVYDAMKAELAVALKGEMDSLLVCFEILDELDDLEGEIAKSLARVATEAQRDDGSWPAAERDAGVTAALVGGYLGRSPWRRPSTADRASRFLARVWSPDALGDGDWRKVGAFAPFYAFSEDDVADGALQWCGRELEKGFRAGLFSAVQVATVLRRCRALALPGAAVDAVELRGALAREQAPDGGFAEGAALPARVAATLRAAAGIRWLYPEEPEVTP